MRLKITVAHTAQDQKGRERTIKTDWIVVVVPNSGKKKQVVLHIDPYDTHKVNVQVEEAKDEPV